MGNAILTKYEVQKDPCYYSTELKWRLHSASFKERLEDKLTIFLFEKKVIDRYAKNTKEQILEVLRKDASSLQRLRHPHILSVVEALSEERSTLAFATKPVVGTVAQLLEHNRHELSNLEMKCGLLDAAEALQFLHQDAKTAHLSFSPYSIFIDPQGKWLLGGLGHSVSGVQWGQLVDCPFAFSGGNDSAGQLTAEPPARYAAPEMCAIPAKCGLESDIFSLGLVTYELMSSERQPLLRGAPRGYTSNILRASTVPVDVYPVLQKVLSPMPNERLTIAAFLNSEFFMDVNVRAIRFLEQLNEKDETQRVTFLKGLPKLLGDPQSPLCGHRVLRERVLPRLCGALLFPALYGVVVPIIVSMLKREKVTDCAHFQAKIWPSFKPLFTAKEIPIEVVTLFLKELDLLVNLAPSPDTQSVLLPFLLRCLELQEPVILNEVLEKVPYLHKKFEYRQVKDQILPRMLQLLLTSSVIKVKVQVLMGLSRIFEVFDKTTITDTILTAFEKLTKTDRTPAVCMCLLGCYDAMSKHLGHKTTSERILPLIMPLLVEDSLSAEQWETQLSVCKKLLQRVEAARRKELDAKKDLQVEAGAALAEKPPETRAAAPAEPQDFESLLFAGTAKAPAPKPQAVPAPTPQAKAPPPPVASVSAPAAKSSDLLGGAGAGLFDGPTPSAPSAMGGFDPFATPATASAQLGPGSFDPFASMSSPAAPAPAPGAFGGMMTPGGSPAGGLAAGMPMFPSGPAGGMPSAGMPSMGQGPGMPPAGGGGGGLAASGLRGMNYDPFAEIDGGGAPGTGGPPQGFQQQPVGPGAGYPGGQQPGLGGFPPQMQQPGAPGGFGAMGNFS
mmetsp:Transcript_1857/g.4131  ORF Transcript_1857/g.4131 Transcript_1857/m.4131 type:complete len:840 (+) Transcript_1857:104-2623(+)